MSVSSPTNKPAAFRAPTPEAKPLGPALARTAASPAEPQASALKKGTPVQDGFVAQRRDVKPQVALDAAAAHLRQAQDKRPAEKVAELEAPVDVSKDYQPQSISGEDAAKKAVDLETVDETLKSTEEAQNKLRDSTHAEVDGIFDMADGKKDVPPGTEVHKTSDTEAELVRKNEAGDVIERAVATRREDGSVVLDSAEFKNGRNLRDRIEANADGGTLAQHAEWPGDKEGYRNEAADLKGFDVLDKDKNPELSSTSNHVYRGSGDQEGQLKIDTFAQSGGAVNGSSTTFFQQEEIGIDDKLEGPFDREKPVDVADTISYSIPAPGADGSQGDPHFMRSGRFSQGDVQATAFIDRKLDGHRQFAGEGTHSREDLDRVWSAYRDGGDGKGENYDADDAYKTGQAPKQWTLEVKNADNSLDAQTFMEGQPKVTTKTHTEVDGNTVKQSYEGTTLKPDSEDEEYVDVKGESTQVYAQDGSLEKMDASRKEPDGTDVEEHYNSTREVTDQGLKLDESLESKKTRDGKTFTSKQEDSSLLTGEGVQLLDSKNTLTDPDGRQAVTQVGKEGQKMTVTGPEGKDPREVINPEDLGDDEVAKDLVINSAVSVSGSIAEVARKGGVNALTALQGLSQGVVDSGAFLPESLTKAVGGAEKLAQASQFAKGGAAGVFGAASVAAGVAGLVDGIQDGNKGAIFKGLVDAGLGGYGLYQGEEAIRQAFKGTTDLVDIMGDDVAKTGGYLKTVGGWMGEAVSNGLSKLGATSAVAKIGSALKGLGGVANVAGAVAGTVTGALDIAAGVNGAHTGKIVNGALSIAGGVGGAVAGIMAASAFGGPIGLAVGAVVGGLVFGIQQLVGLITDDEHQIAEQSIWQPPEGTAPEEDFSTIPFGIGV